MKRSGFGNPYCSKTYCRNSYCGIVAAVSELATFLTRTRSPVFLADDDRECVDANPSACRLLGGSRSQLIARPLDDWLPPDQPEHAGSGGCSRALSSRSDVRVDVAPSAQDAAVSNQGLASDRGRLAAA